MFTLYAFWCDSEKLVHFAFQDRAIAEDWRTRYDETDEFGHQCGPHQLVECVPKVAMVDMSGRCERMLPTGVECLSSLPCPHHGMDFAPLGKAGA